MTHSKESGQVPKRILFVFDVNNRKLGVEFSDSVIQERLSRITPAKPHDSSGVVKHIALVSSASEGAITQPLR